MRTSPLTLIVAVASALLLAACGGGDSGAEGGDQIAGQVVIDGSSTVFPIAEAVAEEFQIANQGVRVSVGVSGTGGGFARFCNGETDVSNASRPIADDERELCAENGIEFTELPIAIDGLSVIANPGNEFAQCLTVEELERIWEPGSTVDTWRDVRAEWPAEEMPLFGPGTDSGTFDYFTETIMGEGGASRTDFQASEDDNILVQGVAGDTYAMGYLGYAYLVENRDRLKVLAVDGGDGCVEPTDETIDNGTYTPLSRPIFIYVKHQALQRPEVRAFMEFALENAPEIVPSTGYLALSAEEYAADMEALMAAATP